jgi:hypothetical protein
MARNETHKVRPPRPRVLAIALSVFAITGSVGTCFGSGVDITLMGAHAVAWAEPRLVILPAGLKLEGKPPEGWSHVVLKSIPRLASGDRGTLPAGASKTATLFRTAILADVQPVDQDEKDWVLARIGVGMCVPQQDHDIVVNSDRVDALGIRLSMVERMVLEAAEAELSEGRIIARTPTFALFRSPATLVVNGKHAKIALYYAFCVERTTGQLRVAVWAMLPVSEPQQPPLALVKLRSGTTFDCELDVRAKRLLNTIPVSWSFAMRSLPPGRTLRVPAPVGALIASTARRPRDADLEQLEESLLAILAEPRDPKNTIRQTVAPPPHGTSP